jgi:hypothetical protein
MELCIYHHNIMSSLNAHCFDVIHPLSFDKSIVICTLPSKTTILLRSTVQVTCCGLNHHVQASMHIIGNLVRSVKNVFQYIFNAFGLFQIMYIHS